MKKILALAQKDLKLLFRDKGGAFFVFVFPLLIAIFFGTVFSGGGGGSGTIPLVIVDEDSTAQSIQFADKIKSFEGSDVLQTDREEAVSFVQKGKRVAYIVLTEGFGQSRENLFWGDPTRIEIGVDPSRRAETAMLKGVLMANFMEGMMGDFTDPEKMRVKLQDDLGSIRESDNQEELQEWEKFLVKLDTAMAQLETNVNDSAAESDTSGAGTSWQPVEFEVSEVTISRDGPKNAFEITFPQALIWAMIGCAASFGISLVTERTHGTLIRLRIAPLNLSQILAGKGTACFTAIMLVAVILITIAILFFGVKPNSMLFLALAIASSAACFVGIMMLLSVIGKTEASAGGIGWAALLVMSMTGGGMIPLFFLPSWLKTVGHASPVKWAILTMEGAIWRGFTPAMMFWHCALLLSIGIVSFIVGARIFKMTVE